MDLVCKDSIDIETIRGLCTVELHYGSLTKLEKKDAVDVLVVSAFPDVYAPVRNTVIGALHNELKISVQELSKDKEEDLRQFFSCWWSKPIHPSKKVHFRRIMCFEGGFKNGSKPPGVIGEVFRSLISLCKNEDIKVAMPLLASGNQRYSEKMMLRLIVDAAIHWIKVGLPLRTLKIVIYAKDKTANDSTDDPLLQHFHELKSKFLSAGKGLQGNELEIKYDIYLSYCKVDQSLASLVQQKLIEQKKDLRIFAIRQEINEEESWQDEIYQVMTTCSRVVTLLTPAFLKDSSCVEQYNIALCCSRTMKRDYLAPLYLKDIDVIPTYMGLIQYIDCRPSDESKILAACCQLSARLTWTKKGAQDNSDEAVVKDINDAKAITSHSRRGLYEVFISYSRANSDLASVIKDAIQKKFPDWRIFLDTLELQAGTAWQWTLYKSIGSKNENLHTTKLQTADLRGPVRTALPT